MEYQGSWIPREKCLRFQPKNSILAKLYRSCPILDKGIYLVYSSWYIHLPSFSNRAWSLCDARPQKSFTRITWTASWKWMRRRRRTWCTTLNYSDVNKLTKSFCDNCIQARCFFFCSNELKEPSTKLVVISIKVNGATSVGFVFLFPVTKSHTACVASPHVRESGIRNPANFCCWNPESRD